MRCNIANNVQEMRNLNITRKNADSWKFRQYEDYTETSYL